MLSRKVSKAFFWSLEPTDKRNEYTLRLLDKRLAKMFEKYKIVILVHYKNSWWPPSRTVTIELFYDRYKADTRLSELMNVSPNEIHTDYRYKPKRMKTRWNPALIYPFTRIIISPFTWDRQPIIIAFNNAKVHRTFLNQLNQATLQYVNERLDMWASVNQ